MEQPNERRERRTPKHLLNRCAVKRLRVRRKVSITRQPQWLKYLRPGHGEGALQAFHANCRLRGIIPVLGASYIAGQVLGNKFFEVRAPLGQVRRRRVDLNLGDIRFVVLLRKCRLLANRKAGDATSLMQDEHRANVCRHLTLPPLQTRNPDRVGIKTVVARTVHLIAEEVRTGHNGI